MVEKISVKMVPHTFGIMKNINKALLVSTDSQPEQISGYENLVCQVLEDLSPNRMYSCTGDMHFNQRNVSRQIITVTTDYGGKCSAYFYFTFHVFLGAPTMKPIIWASWG